MNSHTITCHRCDAPLPDFAYTKRYGFWDADTQSYDRFEEHHLCQSCWNDREGRATGAHYRPDSAQALYDVLAAADGRLAATLTWWSGKPAIRVVDGEPEAAVTKPHDGGTNAEGTPVLRFESEAVDMDRETFDDVADPPDDDAHNLVLLEDPARTAFIGVDGNGVEPPEVAHAD